MSTRLLMNIALGTVALLLIASLGVVVTSLGDRDSQDIQVDLALKQQALVQDLNQEVADLAAADNLLAVNQARSRLGNTVVDFDQRLAALVKGGTVDNPDGTLTTIAKVKNEDAGEALHEAARLWVETGLPLADLAAGEFSIFSAAGQQAVANLTANSPALANQMGIAATALQVKNSSQSARAGLARIAVVGLGLLFGGLAFVRFKPAPKAPAAAPTFAPRHQASPQAEQPLAPAESSGQTLEAPVQTLDWSRHSGNTFTSPVDFDNVNASVDQMSVDMNTIAGSTDKMRVAIDSVGHALQGMLYSLNEMAQDTAEGYKIVRGANNAASYTASTASELAASAREMSRVVARVTQLALKTKQVAAQIDAEAVSTGTTGEKFTSVVAAEVKGLSRQTSAATQEIENTVAEILGTARQYEEAIGQIIKNISAIHKVSENLGELMLHPPAAGVAGTPLSMAQQPLPLDPQAGQAPVAPAAQTPPVASAPQPAAAAPQPVPETPPAPAAPVVEDFEDDVIGEPTVDEVVEETRAAIADASEEIIGGPEAVEMIGSDTPAEKTEDKPTGSSGNVFMLGGGSKKPQKSPTTPELEAKAEAPAPEPEAKDDDGGNIFMLNKPKKSEAETTPVAEPEATKSEPETAPEPEPEPAKEPEAAAEEDDSGSNIFMLNKPKKPVAEAAPSPEPKAEEPVTVPADSDEPKDDGGSGGNIFMLNKPKK